MLKTGLLWELRLYALTHGMLAWGQRNFQILKNWEMNDGANMSGKGVMLLIWRFKVYSFFFLFYPLFIVASPSKKPKTKQKNKTKKTKQKKKTRKYFTQGEIITAEQKRECEKQDYNTIPQKTKTKKNRKTKTNTHVCMLMRTTSLHIDIYSNI